MERLEVKLVIDNTTYINEWYIKVNQDGQECIWKKSTKVKDGQEEVLQNRFYHDASHRPNLQDPISQDTLILKKSFGSLLRQSDTMDTAGKKPRTKC